ncbi:MAG: adenylate/guanylate cyclase domain-containing protein, partial [Alphaproteobacteria bacterium]|nr:adenylate/guanylate cyclase domain-containing protein [Alphaproteobacteria bacterium]
LRIFKISSLDEIVGKSANSFFGGPNKWVAEKLKGVAEKDESLDAEIVVEGETLSVNLSIMPLLDQKKETLGSMVMIEDISSEKRMKSTMSRYMDPDLADQLLEAGESDDFLGGKQSVGTVLFSDVRSFTTITEELGAQGTVKLLNEYFTIMVDCITDEGGMLDKFIGDAMMCIFGTPVPHDDDPDRAVRAAIRMMTDLKVFNDK